MISESKLLNYIGQLRVYSLLDFIIFGTALTRDIPAIIAMTSLWCSGILYLEYVHKDHLRLPVSFFAPLILFLASFMYLPFQIPLLCGFFSFLYAKKKHNTFMGVTAPFWRACINSILALFFKPPLAPLVFALFFTRNLLADFRDTQCDKNQGSTTLPLILGFKKEYRWAFYAHCLGVAVCTAIWFRYSFLDARLLMPILLMQVFIYPLTPRAGLPGYLNPA